MLASIRSYLAGLSVRAKVVAGSVLGLILLVGGWFLTPVPSAQGGLRGHTVNMSPNGAMRVIFSQPMNRRSVEQAFQITPTVEGDVRWEGRHFFFVPKNNLQKGSTYEIVVKASAKSLLGKPLANEYRQSFVIVDFPEVVVAAPVDQSVIMQDQILTVLFDHPLRVLTGDLTVPEYLKIEPSIKGIYRWLGTSGFEFVPTDGWTPATAFKVTIPKGTKVADGGSTLEDKTWTFSTERLQVTLASPSSHHNPKEPLKISFNYPIKPEVLSRSLQILEGEAVLPNDQFTFAVDKDQARSITVTKKGDYQLGKTYTLKLPKGFSADLGPLGLMDEWQQVIGMDELGFKPVISAPANGGEMAPRATFQICFNNPPNPDTFAAGVKVTPEVEELQVQPYGYMGKECPNSMALVSITARWKASAEYAIEFTPALADNYGQKLVASHVVRFKTLPFEPSIQASGYSLYGVLAAHLPRVYQLRTLNWNGPVTANLREATFAEAVKEPFSGSLKAKRAYDTSAPLNTYKILDIDLDQIAGQKLSPGFYELSFDNARTKYGEQLSPRRLTIIDTALTLKRDRAGKILVWATDLKTGEVVPNLDVEVWSGVTSYDRSVMKKVGQGKTDEKGIAMVAVDEAARFDNTIVKATGVGRLGYAEMSWNDGVSVWNYGLENNYDRSLKHHIGYVYTERRIYRSDQKVFFKGVIRLDQDAQLSLPSVKEVDVSIEDPEGTSVFTQKFSLNAFGTFNGSFSLEPSMKLGTYRLRVMVDADKEEPRTIEGLFDVREYRRPDFKVEAVAPTTPVFGGQAIQLPVHAAYYHGVPLSGAKVQYTVSRTKLFFQPAQERWWNDWYNFTAEEDYGCYWYCPSGGGFEQVQTGEAVADEQGNVTLSLPTNLTDYKTSATYAIDVTVVDVNQRQVSSRVELPVHRGEFYVGIRPDYSKGWAASEADFDIVSVNADGSVRPRVDTTVKLYKRTWSNAKKVGADGTSFFEWQPKDELVETRRVTTDGEGRGRLSFSPSKDGEYRAVIEATDREGRLISAAAYRYVYRGEGGVMRISDDHQMKIIQNKASYEVGDTASLAVQTPYEVTKALVTIERNTIREYRVIELGNKQRVVDVKIADADTPNIYVSVLAVKGGGDQGIPEFRLGYANLQVNTTKKILSMTVTPERETYKPGESVTLTVETKNSGGTPVQAEVSIAVVDERVIALLGAIDKDILGKFWFPRQIGIDTAQTLTMLVKKVFFATEGGGGGKGGGDAVPAVRGNFQDTAYWNATVVTGADGKAKVSFKLPDNLTSWNVLAIGETKDTIVGRAESKIVTRRELMAEPLMPRILRHGDTVMVGATLVNATDRALDVKTNLKAEGVSVDGKEQLIRVKPQSREVVTWKIRVPQTGSKAKFTVTANAAEYQDGFEVPLPILEFSVPETVSASGIFEKNVTEHVEIPEGIMPNVGQVDVSVQPNIGSGVKTGLDYLQNYPYECSEQKTSALIANLLSAELMMLKVTQMDAAQLEQAKTNVRNAIKILVSRQRGDGGWSFWPEYYDSYPWLTSYVFWGLTQAQKAGFDVDESALNRADGYLRQALTWSDPMALRGAIRAQVLFMLSERNTDGLSGYMGSLYDQRKDLPGFGQLFLAMAYANVDKGRTSARAVQLMNEIKNRVVYLNPSTAYVKEEKGYEEFLSSDLRTTSLYLQALLRIDPKNQEIERLLRYIVQNRKDGYWYTTQETAITLLGLVEYVRVHPVDDSVKMVSVFLDNQLKQTMKFEKGDVSSAQTLTLPIPELSKTGAVHQIGLEKDSETRYFYDINMKVWREIEDIEPFDNGMTMIAETYALSDAKFERPLREVKQGESVRVHMKLLVPKRRRYVAMEYHLPAGLEAIDFQLKTSPQEVAGEQKQCYPDWRGEQRCLSTWEQSWWWENIWRHIELRDDRVFLFAENLEPGVYEYDFVAQALTPGEYRVPPARAYEFYNPLSNGHNEGKTLKVLAR